MHFQASTGNSSGPTALPFFILLSAFFTFSLLTQFTSLLTTSASSVLGYLLFSSFISFSKYSFHLFNTASEFTITLPFSSFITFTCCISFPSLSLCLANLYNSFSPYFVSNQHTNCHTHVPSPLQLPSLSYSSFLCRSFYYFHFLFCPIFSLSLSFLLCSPELPHSTTMSSCLLFVFQMSLPVQFQMFFLAFLLFCPTHQIIHSYLPEFWSPLV